LASSSQKNHAYLYAHDKKISSIAYHDKCQNHVALLVCHDVAFNFHAMFASSSSHVHGRNGSRRICTVMQKNDKVVARSLGPKCKRAKTCIRVPNYIVTNLVGPNKSWVPKTQA
jgi:hypothetical protein